MLDHGAQPMFRQAPATQPECEALEIARMRATGELPQPRDEWGNGSRSGRVGNRSRCGTGIGTSIVNDGSGHYAQVHWEGGAKPYCYIRQPSGKPGDIHGNDVKGWDGIPKWIEERGVNGYPIPYYSHRKYINAAPLAGWVYLDHCPTDAQVIALQEAKRLAIANSQKRGRYGDGQADVKVRDGSTAYASVHASPGNKLTSCIWEPNECSPGGRCQTQMWAGVPEWESQQTEDTTMSRPGHVNIQAPPTQVHKVYEDHIIVRQRRFFHENAADEHIEGAPQQTAQINMQASTVEAHYSDQPVVHDHRPPQSLLSAILWGVRKPKQQPAALPAPSIDRGELLAAPSQKPLALAHQPAIPMDAVNQKTRNRV